MYGKDGIAGGQQLAITVQLDMAFKMDDKKVEATVFVQPDSAQSCLLGTNVIPLLGIEVTRAKGKILFPVSKLNLSGNSGGKDEMAKVGLARSVRIPSNKC